MLRAKENTPLKTLSIAAVVLFLLGGLSVDLLFAQAINGQYGNNETSINWMETQSPHFKIVFPEGKTNSAGILARQAEDIFKEYQDRLGTAPSNRIIIYYKNNNALVSGIRGQDTDEEFQVWQGSVGMQQLMPGNYTTSQALRAEIAYAFKENIEYFPIDYYFYLFSRPSPSPWSDGLVSYLAVPEVTNSDTLAVNTLANFAKKNRFDSFSRVEWKEMLFGRSQIRYFETDTTNSISEIYSQRQKLFGFIPYFDFNPAFEKATGRSYQAFKKQWEADSRAANKKVKDLNNAASENDTGSLQTDSNSSPSGLDTSPYNSFANIRWEVPFGVPYYYDGDFGLAGYASLKEPLRIHEFSYYGSLSFANPIRKSYFYSEYVNNSLRPRIKFSYNHLPSASGFFGEEREVQTTDVLALSSLWKLTGLSSGTSAWYAVLTLRHLALDYFPQEMFRANNPDIFYTNTKTRQTDLRGILSWRNHVPNRNNLIHPLSGQGVRFSATASDKILGSQVRYARLGVDAYMVLPAVSDQRIFVYGNAVMDIGEPAGRDFLSFSDNGNYPARTLTEALIRAMTDLYAVIPRR